jgi:hypothetical protein
MQRPAPASTSHPMRSRSSWLPRVVEPGMGNAMRPQARGTPSTHPVQGDELRALRRVMREWPEFVEPMAAELVAKLPNRPE